MTERGQYTTVYEVRSKYLAGRKDTDDALILSFIRQATTEITAISNRTFYPTYAKQYYNTPKYGYSISLNGDLMELISVENGDGQMVDLSKIVKLPYNTPTKNAIYMHPADGTWLLGPNGSPMGAIKVTGFWSNIHDPTAGFFNSAYLSDAITDVATSFNVPALLECYVGYIIRIDNELMFVTNVLEVAATDLDPAYVTITVERGINGTTPAVHAKDTVVQRWSTDHNIHMLATAAAVGYYFLRSNPLGMSTTVDGVTFETPKDIADFIVKRLQTDTVMRLGFA